MTCLPSSRRREEGECPLAVGDVPLASTDRPLVQFSSDAGPRHAKHTSGMSLKILIVDDEPIARRVLREELETMDDISVVGEADNGAAALERIARQQPDVVLLDLQMPEMSGFDVVRNLK